MPASTGILCPIHRNNLDRPVQSGRFAIETSLGKSHSLSNGGKAEQSDGAFDGIPL
jgi:hypothetical protein